MTSKRNIYQSYHSIYHKSMIDISAVLNIPTKVKALAKTKGKETG